jgi:hypothetical protein
LPGLIVNLLIKEPCFGWRPATRPNRQYPQDEHLPTQGKGKDIAFSHRVAGFDHPDAVHTNFTSFYELGRRRSAFEYPGEPKPPVETLGGLRAWHPAIYAALAATIPGFASPKPP